jgi:hypothetical protein
MAVLFPPRGCKTFPDPPMEWLLYLEIILIIACVNSAGIEGNAGEIPPFGKYVICGANHQATIM